MLRATLGTRVEEMTGRPRMRPGEGITGSCRRGARAGDDRGPGAPRRALQGLPEPARGRIRVDPRGARSSRASKLEGALNVRTREPREFTEAEIDLLLAIAAQVAQTIEHAKLYAQAQRRVVELEALARISEAVSESLYLEESLEGDRRGDGRRARRDGSGDRAGGRRDRVAGGPRREARGARCRCAGSGRQIGELVCDRDTPFTRRRPGAARLDRAPCGGRAGARARCDARRARPGDPPPGQEQPADRRVAAAAAGAIRRRRRDARRSTTR